MAANWIFLVVALFLLSCPLSFGYHLNQLESFHATDTFVRGNRGKIWWICLSRASNGTSAFVITKEFLESTNSRVCDNVSDSVLHFRSFAGLFIITAAMSIMSLLTFVLCALLECFSRGINVYVRVVHATACDGPIRSEKSAAQNLPINFLASISLFTSLCLNIFTLFLSLKNKKFAERLKVGLSIDNKQDIDDKIRSDCIAGSSELINCSSKNENIDKQAQFSIEDIINITNNYECRIGEGGFGIVYHGLLHNGDEVAVKVFKFPNSETIIDQFANEVELLMKVKHENLVPFYGYCDDSTNKAIICKFISGGDLKKHLTVPSPNSTALILDWIRRLKIALGTARGLKYLHEELHIVHRDVKPENIFLDENFEPKIADFGFSLLFTEEAVTRVLTEHVIGTLGYIDPEYYRTNTLSYRSDVYSFGVILLQLITGKPAIVMANNTHDEKIHLTRWVNQRSNLDAVVDLRFGGNFHRMSVKQALDLAKRCTKLNSIERPTMKEVTSEVESLLKIESIRQK